MDDKTDDTKPAKKAVAARPAKDDWSTGEVSASEVTRGTLDSDSVRRVQHALQIEVTGNYDDQTTQAVRRWQNTHGYVGGRGINPNAEQVAKLLGDDYTVVDE